MVIEQHSASAQPAIAQPRLRSLGKYRLLELIGSGAMGDVYRAEHVLLGRKVAVKVLRGELARERSLVERFFAEARAVNLVGHPHIVEVTDFAREPDGTVWFVMELLDGIDLGTLLRNERPSLRRSLEIARQICDALDAVHAVGIIHRDIKPENVFLVQREGRDFVKLLDFGIARVPEPRERTRGTLRGVVLGTPPYMAPEQASGLEIDQRSDVYAVGAVLFELISGRAVFEQPTLRAMLADVTLKPAPRLGAYAQLPASVGEQVDELLARCLAKDPALRPDSARALARELSAIAAQLTGCTTDTVQEQEPPAVALAVRPEHTRSERPSSQPVTGYRKKSSGRALWLGAALLGSAAGAWVGPWLQAREAPAVEASAQPAAGAAHTGAIHVVGPAQPSAAAPQPLAPAEHALPSASAQLIATQPRADVQALERSTEPSTEARARHTRRHVPSVALPPPAPAEPVELHREPIVAVHELSLAAAPEPRDLDPEKLLDPFAGE
jgi:serine/threonine-protein kinase